MANGRGGVQSHIETPVQNHGAEKDIVSTGNTAVSIWLPQ